MYPKCSLCGRDPAAAPALMVQTMYDQWVCSPCVYQDALNAVEQDRCRDIECDRLIEELKKQS